MDSRARAHMREKRNKFRKEKEVESLDRQSRYVDDEGRTLVFEEGYNTNYPAGFELMSKFYIVDDDSNLIQAVIPVSNLERDTRIALLYKLPPSVDANTIHGVYSEAGKVMSIKLSQDEFARTSSAVHQQKMDTQELNLKETQKVGNLPQMVRNIWLDEGKSQLLATRWYRLLLTSDSCPPIDDVLKGQIVPRLAQFLGCENSKQLRIESALALAEIGCARPEVVVNHISVPRFVELLSSPCCEITELVAYTLGNLVSRYPSFSDQFLRSGVLDALLNRLNEALNQVNEEHLKLSMLKAGTTTLSNLFRGRPPHCCDQMKLVLPLLLRLISLSGDEEVISDACWALLYLSDGPNFKMQAVIDAGICPVLFQLLKYRFSSVLCPAILTAVNIVRGNENQWEIFVKEMLPSVHNILYDSYDFGVKRSACKIVAIITATNTNYIESVMEANIVVPLVKLVLSKKVEAYDAAFALSTMASEANFDQVDYLVNAGCLKLFCEELLDSPYEYIVVAALKAIKNILENGEASSNEMYNNYVGMFTAAWVNELYNLHGHDYSVISATARNITSTYW